MLRVGVGRVPDVAGEGVAVADEAVFDEELMYALIAGDVRHCGVGFVWKGSSLSIYVS